MDQWQLQEGLYFLTEKTRDLDLTKPVALHSMRVAEILYNVTGDEDLVLAGYCHDLIEDAGVTYEEIEERFGILVAEIVEVNTIEDDARGDDEGERRCLERIAEAGEGAASVKAADLADNLQHYRDYHDEEKWVREREGLNIKRNLFLELCGEYKDTPLYKVIESYSFEDHDRASVLRV